MTWRKFRFLKQSRKIAQQPAGFINLRGFFLETENKGVVSGASVSARNSIRNRGERAKHH